jgi:hypothetical protein
VFLSCKLSRAYVVSVLLMSLYVWQENIDIEGSGGRVDAEEPSTQAVALGQDALGQDDTENWREQV